MKKTILATFVLTLGLAFITNAQTISSLERQVVASSGQYLTSPNLTLSCTVGEPVVATLVNIKLILTQGFQQPLENDTVTSVITNTADWSIKAYPNPFADNVNIEISSDVSSDFVVKFTNLLGQSIGMDYMAHHYPGKNVYSLNTTSLATGMYVVTVASKDGKLVKSFKLTRIL